MAWIDVVISKLNDVEWFYNPDTTGTISGKPLTSTVSGMRPYNIGFLNLDAPMRNLVVDPVHHQTWWKPKMDLK